MRELRLVLVLVFFLVLPSCDDSPSQPATTTTTTPPAPAAPASVSLGVQQTDASASAHLIAGTPQVGRVASFTFTWENLGGSPASVTDVQFQARHAGGRNVTRNIELAENNSVLPNDRLVFSYDYFYQADQGAANLNLQDFRATSNWTDSANSVNGSASIDFTAANNNFVGPDTRPCMAGSNTLCLQNDRFQVTVDWQNASGQTGVGTVGDTTDDQGELWFFDSSNIDLVVQVLNRCDFNGHYWVFAAATTDVTFDIQIVDTQTGFGRSYGNPFQGVVPPAIQDTEAFATCPGPIPVPVP